MDNNDLSLLGIREDVKHLTEAFQSLEKRIDPLLEAYDSVLFGKKFLVGLATIIGSITAIGAAILWIVNYIRHGN